MYQILIVDDEPMSANGLSQALQEYSQDFIIFTAYSGEIAVEFARNRIDILLTDIYMPKIDGYALLDEILKLWPRCKAVFLTGNSSIETAQRAIRSSAIVDYILKNEKIETVFAAVKKAIVLIESEIQSDQIKKEAALNLQRIRPIMQQDFLRRLLRGRTAQDWSMQKSLDDLGINLDTRLPVILLAARLEYTETCESMIEENIKENMLISVIDQYFFERFTFVPVKQSDDVLVWFIQIKGGRQAANGRSDEDKSISMVFSSLEMLQRDLNRMSCTVSFILDDGYYEFGCIPARFSALMSTLDKSRLMLGEALIREPYASGSNSTPEIVFSEVRSMLAQGRYQDLSEYFKGLFSARVDTYTRMRIYLVLCRCFAEKISGRDNEAFFYNENLFGSPGQIIDDFGWERSGVNFDLIVQILSSGTETSGGQMGKIIAFVNRHIENNLSGDLSLGSVASMVYLSPTYLSRIYKATSGIGYLEYVIETRLKKAAQILNRSECKVADAAREVGYDSVSYFIRSFKKYYGMTPAEYQEKYTH